MSHALPIGAVTAVVLGAAVAAVAQPTPAFVLETDAAYTMAFGDQFYGAVTAGAGDYFAVWVDARVHGIRGTARDLYAQRIRPDGTVAHPGSTELLRDPARAVQGVPAVAWNGSVYLVVWYEGATLFGMRVGADGQVLDPGGFVVSSITGSFRWPAAASDGQDFLVLQVSGNSVVAQRIGGDGVVLDPAPLILSSGASGLGYPKAAFGSGVYLTVWAQAPAQAIRAARVTSAGDVLDPGGVNVSGGGDDVDAHVDFDGVNFYVVWARRDGNWWDLWGAHVSPQAQVVSPPRLLLDGNTWGYVLTDQVAFNGTHHLIAISTPEPIFAINTDLYALMVDQAGAPVGPPFAVSTLDGRSQDSYGVASVGSQFFIVWEANYISGVSFVYDTEGARIDKAGVVLDRPDPIAVSTCAAWQISSAASFDGENFLCVFEDWREGKPYYQPDLYGVRVTPQGQVLDPAAFRVAGGAQRAQQQPDAAFGDGQHVVVYENNVGAVNEVRMVRVRPDGVVLDPDGILVFSNEPTAETFRPKVSWNGQKYFVVWYDNYLFPGQKPLQFALVRTDGTIERGPVSVTGSDGASLVGFEVGSNGTDFLLAWTDFNDIRAARINNAGSISGVQSVQSTGNWITDSVVVAFNGQSYLVAWSQWGSGGVSVFARPVATNGTPFGQTVTVAGPQYGAVPYGAFSQGDRFIVVGTRSAGPEGGELFSARLDAGGVPLGPPETLATFSRDETYAGSSVGWAPDGTTLAVHSLWAGNPYNTPRAHGQLFDLGGLPPGDINGDGLVNQDDVEPFVRVLIGMPLAPEHVARSDLNGDGLANGADAQTFVELLVP